MTNKTKYSVEQKQEILLNLLEYFNDLNNKSNQALVEFGESKYTSPFERIEVQDIKDYALRDNVDAGWNKF